MSLDAVRFLEEFAAFDPECRLGARERADGLRDICSRNGVVEPRFTGAFLSICSARGTVSRVGRARAKVLARMFNLTLDELNFGVASSSRRIRHVNCLEASADLGPLRIWIFTRKRAAKSPEGRINSIEERDVLNGAASVSVWFDAGENDVEV
jgi:hypothetical protein